MVHHAAIDAVADALPKEQREAYLRTMSKLREVPEDDEYLLVLEAIGFTSLILRDIPERVGEVLAASPGVENPSSTEYLLSKIRDELEVLNQLPSHRDLKLQIEELGRLRIGLSEDWRKLSAKLDLGPAGSRPRHVWCSAFLVGTLVGAALIYSFTFL